MSFISPTLIGLVARILHQAHSCNSISGLAIDFAPLFDALHRFLYRQAKTALLQLRRLHLSKSSNNDNKFICTELSFESGKTTPPSRTKMYAQSLCIRCSLDALFGNSVFNTSRTILIFSCDFLKSLSVGEIPSNC